MDDQFGEYSADVKERKGKHGPYSAGICGDIDEDDTHLHNIPGVVFFQKNSDTYTRLLPGCFFVWEG